MASQCGADLVVSAIAGETGNQRSQVRDASDGQQSAGACRAGRAAGCWCVWHARGARVTRGFCQRDKRRASLLAFAQAATAGQLVVTTPAKIAALLREGFLTPKMLEQRLQVRGD